MRVGNEYDRFVSEACRYAIRSADLMTPKKSEYVPRAELRKARRLLEKAIKTLDWIGLGEMHVN